MAAGECVVVVKFDMSGADIVELGECLAELADLVPDWHQAEKQVLMERIVAVLSHTVAIKQKER